MSQSEKAGLYRLLKDAGVTFERHYRDYTTEELRTAAEKLRAAQAAAAPAEPEPQVAPDADPEAANFFGFDTPEPQPEPAAGPVPGSRPAPPPPPPRRDADPDEMAGQRLNQQDELEPIRTDEHGRVWFQEEVRKPAFPKPRGRRVLTYIDSGAVTKTVHNGQYQETFEVPGDRKREAQVKITLPSYQVGIFADRRFPFRVVTYGGEQGFKREDVQTFYGGAELVPAEIKRKYVANVLCYDMRTTIRSIESEHRRLQLLGRQPA